MARARQAAEKDSADGSGANHAMGRQGGGSAGICGACVPGLTMVLGRSPDPGCALAHEWIIEDGSGRAVDESAGSAVGGLACPRPEYRGVRLRNLIPNVHAIGFEAREGIKAARGQKKLAQTVTLLCHDD